MMKKAVFWISLALLMATALYGGAWLANVTFPWQRAEAIATALAWGGLAELPPEAEIVRVERRGSPFTRQFVVVFRSAQPDRWVRASRRLRDRPPETRRGRTVYEVNPGEGNSIGGTVALVGNQATISMSWS
jgi:hypothetical protein